MKYEYLLLKRNGNRHGLIYDKRFFNNSKNARKDFRKNDILLKCKKESIFYSDNWNGWCVKSENVIARYEK